MFLLFNIVFCLFILRYELEKKSILVTHAFSAKSCTRDTDSLHSCTRLRLVQEMAFLYHECKILPRKHSYPNLIPIWKGQGHSSKSSFRFFEFLSTLHLSKPKNIDADVIDNLKLWKTNCCNRKKEERITWKKKNMTE